MDSSSTLGSPSGADVVEEPILSSHADLPGPQQIVWRLLLAHIKNKSYNVSQFFRMMKQCKPKANLLTIASEDGFSLLHEVIRHKRADLIEVFQYCGMLVIMYNQPVGPGSEYASLTPVDLCDRFGATKERQEMERNMKIERNIQKFPIRIACRDGVVRRFNELMRNDYFIGSSTDSMACLDWAIVSGLVDMVEAVIQVERIRGHQRASGEEQVKLCMKLGHSSLLEPLLNHLRVDLNAMVVDGKSLTEKAAEYGDVDTFNVLKNHGASLSVTVMSIAAAFGKQDFVLECITHHVPPLNVNYSDRRKKTALHFAAERGYPSVVDLLVSHSADLTARDMRSRSVLHHAAEKGNIENLDLIVRLLDARHLLSTILVSQDQYLGSEMCYLIRGRDQERPAWHYVHVDRGRLDIFKVKTRGGAVDVASYGHVIKSGWGTSPNQDIIEEVESKYDMANISQTAALDMLPLHLAILKGNTECAIRLVELTPQSHINQTDCFGLTPLHYACMRGNMRCITALINKGASQNHPDTKGRTPAQIAVQNNHQHVVDYFKSGSLLGAVDIFAQANIQTTMNVLAREELDRRLAAGENIQQYIRTVLRDLNSDINNFLFDELHASPVMEESSSSGQG